MKCWGTIKKCTTWQKDFKKSSKSKSNHPSKIHSQCKTLEDDLFHSRKITKEQRKATFHQDFPDNLADALQPPEPCSSSTQGTLCVLLSLICRKVREEGEHRVLKWSTLQVHNCKAVSESEVKVPFLWGLQNSNFNINFFFDLGPVM